MSEPAADHPGVDALCDLDGGLLAGTPAEADVEYHVADCASCTAFLASLSSTRDQLADLPALPMPVDVVARINAALAGEAARDVDREAEPAAHSAAAVTSLDSARRKRGPRWTRGAGAVAAGVALLMAGAVGIGVLNTETQTSGPTSSAEGGNSAPDAGAQRDSAAAQNYTQATLAAGVRDLVAGRSTAAGTPQTKSASPLLGAQQDKVGPPDLDRLRSPAELTACIAELTGRAGVKPLAVAFATYEGEPALIIVLPDADPTAVQAWVVGPGCSPGNPDVRHREVVPRVG